LRHAVLVTFGATTTFSQIGDGLHWLDEAAGKYKLAAKAE
jgi:hypothetical protein